MEKRNIIFFLVILISVTSCKSQDDITYWRVKTLYHSKKEPIHGATLVLMEEIVKNNFHVSYNQKEIKSHYPIENEVISAEELFHNNILKETKKHIKVKSVQIKNDNLLIEFKYNGTLKENKTFILEFLKMDRESFFEKVNSLKNKAKSIEESINNHQFSIPSLWKEPIKKPKGILLKNYIAQKSKVILEPNYFFNYLGTSEKDSLSFNYSDYYLDEEGSFLLFEIVDINNSINELGYILFSKNENELKQGFNEFIEKNKQLLKLNNGDNFLFSESLKVNKNTSIRLDSGQLFYVKSNNLKEVEYIMFTEDVSFLRLTKAYPIFNQILSDEKNDESLEIDDYLSFFDEHIIEKINNKSFFDFGIGNIKSIKVVDIKNSNNKKNILLKYYEKTEELIEINKNEFIVYDQSENESKYFKFVEDDKKHRLFICYLTESDGIDFNFINELIKLYP